MIMNNEIEFTNFKNNLQIKMKTNQQTVMKIKNKTKNLIIKMIKTLMIKFIKLIRESQSIKNTQIQLKTYKKMNNIRTVQLLLQLSMIWRPIKMIKMIK